MKLTPEAKKGFFVVLDGLEGTGKTTQTQLLRIRLEAAGFTVVTSREPGGSPGAEEIRKLVVTGDGDRWDGTSELMLFSAARRNHVKTLIQPSLLEGKIVLCDRFVPCTIAYQGFGRGLALEKIRHVTAVAIGDFEPDLTFLFFIDPILGIQRSKARNGIDGAEVRFESMELAFHHRVHDGYRYVLEMGNRSVPTELQKYQEIVITDNQPLLSLSEKIDVVTNQLYDTIMHRIDRDRPWLVGQNKGVR